MELNNDESAPSPLWLGAAGLPGARRAAARPARSASLAAACRRGFPLEAPHCVPHSSAGPAVDAVLATLGRPAKRCLRLACRGGRAEVDARITRLALPAWRLPDVAAAAPRLRALARLTIDGASSQCLPGLVAALGAIAPSLSSLDILPAEVAMYGGEALRAALARCGALRELAWPCGRRPSPSAAAAPRRCSLRRRGCAPCGSALAR